MTTARALWGASRVVLALFFALSVALVAEGFLRLGDASLLLLFPWTMGLAAFCLVAGLHGDCRARRISFVAFLTSLGLVLDYAFVTWGTFTGGSDSFKGFSLVSYLLTGPLLLVAAWRERRRLVRISLGLVGFGVTAWMPVGALTTVGPLGYLLTALSCFLPAALGAALMFWALRPSIGPDATRDDSSPP